MYYIDCSDNCYMETEKAIGFDMVTGHTSRNIGMKWLPKSKIEIIHPLGWDEKRVKIIVPFWLLKDIINSKTGLSGAFIEQCD